MRLTLDEARKFISGKQRKARPPKMYVRPNVDADLLGTYVRVDCAHYIKSYNEIAGESKWAKHGRRKNDHALIAGIAHALRHVRAPAAVGFVRISPGKLDDDNLNVSFKYLRDAIAKVYGRDDAQWKKGAIAWTYAEMSQGKLYGVRIAVVGSLI